MEIKKLYPWSYNCSTFLTLLISNSWMVIFNTFLEKCTNVWHQQYDKVLSKFRWSLCSGGCGHVDRFFHSRM